MEVVPGVYWAYYRASVCVCVGGGKGVEFAACVGRECGKYGTSLVRVSGQHGVWRVCGAGVGQEWCWCGVGLVWGQYGEKEGSPHHVNTIGKRPAAIIK